MATKVFASCRAFGWSGNVRHRAEQELLLIRFENHMKNLSEPNYIAIDNVEYHWTAEKLITNLSKHGIHFSEAALVFSDPNHSEEKNIKHSMSEPRFESVGLVNNRHLLVVYCDVSDDDIECIRIISAREATPSELKKYREEFMKR